MLDKNGIKKGDQICVYYGTKNNRFRIVNMGFLIQNNPNDAFAIHVPVGDSELVALVYKGKDQDDLLTIAREAIKKETSQEPSEMEVIERAIKELKRQQIDTFGADATTIDHDQEEIKKTSLSYRTWLAVRYRLDIKLIIQEHIETLEAKL